LAVTCLAAIAVRDAHMQDIAMPAERATGFMSSVSDQLQHMSGNILHSLARGVAGDAGSKAGGTTIRKYSRR